MDGDQNSDKSLSSEQHEGDKVRVRAGDYAGRRGRIEHAKGEGLAIRLDTGDLVKLNAEQITNFSRAARRAWAAMPKHAGRPRGSAPAKRPVNIRLDADVWERLAQAQESGLIKSREQAINGWLRSCLSMLLESTNPPSLCHDASSTAEND